jgi:hypothetical protein
MNLQESIYRIKTVMGILTEEENEVETYPSSSKAYHLTPDIYINSIKKNGLTPKTENKLSSHPERIYLYLNPESSYKKLASDLWTSSKHKDNIKNYYVLEIDLTQIPEHTFYQDPESLLGYIGIYTKQGIPPSAINIVETLPVQDLPSSSILDDEPDDEEYKKETEWFKRPDEPNKWEELLKRFEQQ